MICFAWNEFPQYAARCVGAYVKSTNERVIVIATKPKVPIMGMERFAGCEVIWVDANDLRTMRELLNEIPRVLVVSGWAIPCFNRYRDEVREAGGAVVAMVDNNYHQSIKELLKAMRFRVKFRRKYNGFIVPGKSGMRLMRYYGVPKEKVQMGMYAADDAIFINGSPLEMRSKKIIYVGQLIGRKNVVRMCEVFQQVNDGTWELELYGCGCLKGFLVKQRFANVRIYDFLQPEELSIRYRNARIFCLPSIEDHWGLVVHEAALSGCYMLLSDRVGAGEDFLGEDNGCEFNPYDKLQMSMAFKRAMAMSYWGLQKAQVESLRLGRNVSVDGFVSAVSYFVNMQGV